MKQRDENGVIGLSCLAGDLLTQLCEGEFRGSHGCLCYLSRKTYLARKNGIVNPMP